MHGAGASQAGYQEEAVRAFGRAFGRAEGWILEDWVRSAFDEPYQRGDHTAWRAVIAAALGERAEATDLLRQAFDEGQFLHDGRFHYFAEMDSVRDYAPFQRALRPEGR